MLLGFILKSFIKTATLCIKTFVLPLPAPARINLFPNEQFTALYCCSFNSLEGLLFDI